MSMNGNKTVKAEYIRDDAYGFIKGKMYECFPAKSKFGDTEMLCIIDNSGEEYAYPSSWFRIVED